MSEYGICLLQLLKLVKIYRVFSSKNNILESSPKLQFHKKKEKDS